MGSLPRHSSRTNTNRLPQRNAGEMIMAEQHSIPYSTSLLSFFLSPGSFPLQNKQQEVYGNEVSRQRPNATTMTTSTQDTMLGVNKAPLLSLRCMGADQSRSFRFKHSFAWAPEKESLEATPDTSPYKYRRVTEQLEIASCKGLGSCSSSSQKFIFPGAINDLGVFQHSKDFFRPRRRPRLVEEPTPDQHPPFTLVRNTTVTAQAAKHESTRYGKVKFAHFEKKYGFVTDETTIGGNASSGEVFFHFNELATSGISINLLKKAIKKKLWVQYTIEGGDRTPSNNKKHAVHRKARKSQQRAICLQVIDPSG